MAGKRISEAEREIMDAVTGNVDIGNMDAFNLTEAEAQLAKQAEEVEALDKQVMETAQDAKDAHPNIESKSAHFMEIDNDIESVKQINNAAKEENERAQLTLSELKSARKDLNAQIKAQKAVERSKKMHFAYKYAAEKTISGFKKMAELGREATISLTAARSAAEKSKIAKNFDRGFASIQNEIAKAHLQAKEEQFKEANKELAELDNEYKKAKNGIRLEAEDRARKKMNTPLYRITRSFSRKGRDELRNPTLALQKLVEKDRQYKKLSRTVEKNYGKPLEKALRKVDRLEQKVIRYQDKLDAYKDKMEAPEQSKSYKELYQEVRDELKQQVVREEKHSPAKDGQSRNDDMEH